MNHPLLAELFRSASNYHGALAAYAAALRHGDDIEDAAQTVVGASLRYRLAIGGLLEQGDAASLRVVASPGRLRRLRALVYNTSRQYNAIKRSPAARP